MCQLLTVISNSLKKKKKFKLGQSCLYFEGLNIYFLMKQVSLILIQNIRAKENIFSSLSNFLPRLNPLLQWKYYINKLKFSLINSFWCKNMGKRVSTPHLEHIETLSSLRYLLPRLNQLIQWISYTDKLNFYKQMSLNELNTKKINIYFQTTCNHIFQTLVFWFLCFKKQLNLRCCTNKHMVLQGTNSMQGIDTGFYLPQQFCYANQL